MIVKILKKSATFKAIRYNSQKMEKDLGELLLVKNFGVLQGIENLRPQDYINYLEALSSKSNRIKYPQFHVAISTKGRAHSKEELSTIAQQWMQGMGYEAQPYLLIYHKDTENNHIHIVSSRVGRDGKKIADTYEKIRAYQVLNQILAKDQHSILSNYLQKALEYSFSTRAQFAMLLELHGYSLDLKDNFYKISKYGRMIAKIDVKKVDACIAVRHNKNMQKAQIRALIQRYAGKYDKTIRYVDNKYSSSLANFLHEKFGLQFFFHGKANNTPFGYTIVDHKGKSVFKGSEIMPLRTFIAEDSVTGKAQDGDSQIDRLGINTNVVSPLMDNIATIHAIPSIVIPTLPSVDIDININPNTIALDINIADDVDDEAVHARRRRGKQKSDAIRR